MSTTSPDMPFPSTACIVQKNIGAKKAAAFDINASCTGFLYALHTAEMFIKNGQAQTALVVAAEVKSRFVNPEEKETAILFGDGAGAVVLQHSKSSHPLNPLIPLSKGGLKGDCGQGRISRGILGTWLYADGSNWQWIHLPAGGSRMPTSSSTIASGFNTMRMNGSKIYRVAIKTLVSMVADSLKRCGLRIEDIDIFIFHQANLRIVKQIIHRLGIPEEKVPLSLTFSGNTSSASIPITLHQVVRDRGIKEGNLVLMASFGGGLTWGTSIIRW